MKTGYAFQEMKENMARAMSKDAPVSTKVAIEISAFLRHRSTADAKAILNRVLKMKQAIPYKKYTDGVGHRKGAGIAAGRYPQKASTEFIKLIEMAETNAQSKGLSTDLQIVHLAAQKPSNQFHYGRQRRMQFKRTHLEIVVEEQEKTKDNDEKKKLSKSKIQTKPKTEAKVEIKSETKPKTKTEEAKQ